MSFSETQERVAEALRVMTIGKTMSFEEMTSLDKKKAKLILKHKGKHKVLTELPSKDEFRKAYLTDDHEMAKLYALEILNEFCAQKPLVLWKSIPIKLFTVLKDVLSGYGVTILKSAPITSSESLFEFRIDPNLLID